MNKICKRVLGVVALLFIATYIAALSYSTIILIQKSLQESGWYLWGLPALFFITGCLIFPYIE